MVCAQPHRRLASRLCLVISSGQDNNAYSNNYGEFSNQLSVVCTFGLFFKTPQHFIRAALSALKRC